MILKTNYKALFTFLVLSIYFTNNTNGQLWKKLKNKLEKKAQQKLEEKIDKETDKLIDSTLYGKKGNKKNTI